MPDTQNPDLSEYWTSTMLEWAQSCIQIIPSKITEKCGRTKDGVQMPLDYGRIANQFGIQMVQNGSLVEWFIIQDIS